MLNEQDLDQKLDFCNAVIKLADEFDLSITSWYRSPKRNESVGGKPTSKHLRGLAVDVVLDKKEDTDNFTKRVNQYGLVWLNEGDHIHCQIKGG